jgi:transmembrane sensor
VNVGGAGAGQHIELVSGEATVLARSRKVELVAGEGRTAADIASFNVRYEGDAVCVTCLEGAIEVTQGQRATRLQQNQQLVYSAAEFGAPVAVDANAVTGWRDGDLNFDNETLARVIEEINRYRAGRIFLMNDALGRKRLTAHFKLAKLDLVIGQLQTAYGAHARQLPGGIVLIS